MKRAVIYARVSTPGQEEEETIQSQIDAIKERIVQDDATLVGREVYRDEGFSGSILQRPSLDELREDCKQGIFDVVYVFDYGRLSRELTDLLIIKDDIERNDIQVVSLFERITGDPAIDRLLLQIMGAVHEYEKKKITQRFYNGKLQKAKRGDIVGYNAPYGYRYIPITRQGNKKIAEGYFEIYEPEAVVVRQMFDWVIKDGASTYELIRKLHAAGIPPQKGKSEYWTRGPVSRIIKNQSYIGIHHYNKTEAVLPKYRRLNEKYRKQMKTGRKIKDKEHWIEHKIPKIIDKGVFEKAQEQLQRNVKFKPGNKKHDYLLTGLVFCSCESRRNGDGPTGKKYYRCISRHAQPDRKNRCKVGGLNVPILDAMVWKETTELLTNPALIRKHAKRWADKNSSESAVAQSKAKDLSNQLIKLTEEESRYVEAYGKGIMPIDTFEAKMSTIQPAKDSLKREIENLSKNRGKADKINVEELAKRAATKIGKLDFKQKRFIVERVIEKIVATPKEVQVWGHIPIPALAGVSNGKVKYEPINRNRWAT